MTTIYVDATTLIALGSVGELAVLTALSGTLTIVPDIRAEVTTQPARENLDQFCARDDVVTAVDSSVGACMDRARSILDAAERTGDVVLFAAVLAHTDADESVAIVSDDRRVRTVADGLGATVTGTIGVIVRAVADGRSAAEARELVRRIDSRGLHLTAELRETAETLIDEAAADSRG
ncbi:MAG: hypothetical protein U5K37_08765 [Natrialbaceae archaeon]|nr:hypothetical protein [Natrialbaceae archaeon]